MNFFDLKISNLPSKNITEGLPTRATILKNFEKQLKFPFFYLQLINVFFHLHFFFLKIGV